MGVSVNGGFPQQPWVFLLKMIILGCEMGVPLFLETTIYTKQPGASFTHHLRLEDFHFFWECPITTKSAPAHTIFRRSVGMIIQMHCKMEMQHLKTIHSSIRQLHVAQYLKGTKLYILSKAHLFSVLKVLIVSFPSDVLIKHLFVAPKRTLAQLPSLPTLSCIGLKIIVMQIHPPWHDFTQGLGRIASSFFCWDNQ